MLLSARQFRSMSLAGTVAVPQTFPELGRISIVLKSSRRPSGVKDAGRDLLVVEHELSPKLTISRTFFLEEVAAVFVPTDPAKVDFEDGTWLVADEVGDGWPSPTNGSSKKTLGIAYVREDAATFMQVEVGMTAAESAEYYPPLPGDRSVDHYRFSPLKVQGTGVCGTARGEPDDGSFSVQVPTAPEVAAPVPAPPDLPACI